MRFVPDDEDNVCGDFVRRLVSFPLEGDLSARFPARFDVDSENFLLFLGSSVIGENSP